MRTRAQRTKMLTKKRMKTRVPGRSNRRTITSQRNRLRKRLQMQKRSRSKRVAKKILQMNLR